MNTLHERRPVRKHKRSSSRNSLKNHPLAAKSQPRLGVKSISHLKLKTFKEDYDELANAAAGA